MKRSLLMVVGAVLLIVLVWSVAWVPDQQADGLVRVVAVVDGDTIIIEGGEQVRYIGVDTPETVVGSVECYGSEATERNVELVLGKRVRLERDITERDRYGRLLRYVYVPSTASGQGDELSVSFSLIASGFGRALYIEPDTKYYGEFKEAQEAARSAQLGLWDACR